MKPYVVVLPCFNEAQRLQPLEIVRLARQPQIRVICVDDGSTDDTVQLLEEIASHEPESIAVLKRAANDGRGAAVRDGMLAAIAGGAQYVGFLDADLAAPVDEILKLFAVLDSGQAQVAMGARVRRLGTRIERSVVRRVLGRAFANLAAIAIDVPLYDTQCGAKAFVVTPQLARVLAKPFLAGWTFDVELIARWYHDAKADIIEVPLDRWRDVPGSKLTLKDAARALFDLARVSVRTRLRGEQGAGRESDVAAAA
jgi:dolichyl-phosphate beta-glucosyltransferase